MTTTLETKPPDTSLMTFKVSARSMKYGDKRKFVEYRILMFIGSKLVGMEDGPRRSTADRQAALKAARSRIRILRSHRLFAIEIKRKHISDGEARSCHACAIAQALWHNQERMGFDKRRFNFEVSPYAAFVTPRGLLLHERYGDSVDVAIPPDEMPDIAICIINGRPYSEGMAEWSMGWDEWAESRNIGLREWREQNGYPPDQYPDRPGPCSFVLDLDAMVEPQPQ